MIGQQVMHTVPAMFYGNPGMVTGSAGRKYGVDYWWVQYQDTRGQQHQTAFATHVLRVITGKGDSHADVDQSS